MSASSLSPETLELVARGLGCDAISAETPHPRSSSPDVWPQRFYRVKDCYRHADDIAWQGLSLADLASHCKAKLRESWLNCEAWHGPNAASARIYQPMGYGKLDTFAFHEVCGPESSDDECVILAFAHVVAKGALP